jgi:Lsr2
MAVRTTIVLEDDIEGGPADETVKFSLGGKEYEIDLNNKNATRFRSQLAPFVKRARPASSRQSRRPARTASSRQRSAAIRAWAKQRGMAVSDRGRIPASVIEQYQASARGR